MTDTIQHAKRQIRAEIRSALASMSEADRREGSMAICTRVGGMPYFVTSRTIMFYLPMTGEPDITPLIESALRDGRTVCVPEVNWEKREIRPTQIESLDARSFKVDRHGLRIPVSSREIGQTRLDLVIVPGLAFDRQGRRLGRAAGFYDRFLGGLDGPVTTVGVAFERQIVENVPVEPHDVSVDLVVTDRHVFQG